MAVGKFYNPIASGGSTSEPTTGLFGFGQGRYVLGVHTITVSQVAEGIDWDYVALGNGHGLGIKGGYLYSWGLNSSGRTGLGATSGVTYVPTQVGSYNDWYYVSAGYDHSLGIRKTWNTDHYDYTLWIFGEGASYATGLGNTLDKTSPYQIGTDTDWEWCSAGYQWSVAVKNGVLYTCGNNNAYRTGQNTTAGYTTTWTSYDSSTGWAKCYAGYKSGIAIKTDGTLWGWGENGSYVLGTGDSTDIAYPTQIGTDTDWSHGSCGASHSLMIKTDGTLHGAGSGLYYKFGNNSTSNLTSWTQIGTDTDWNSVKTDGNISLSYFSVAIKGGKLFVCGNNSDGRTGLSIAIEGDYVEEWTQSGTGTNYVDIGISSVGGMACRQ